MSEYDPHQIVQNMESSEATARSVAYITWLEAELTEPDTWWISSSSFRNGYTPGNEGLAEATDSFVRIIDDYARENYIGQDADDGESKIVNFIFNQKGYFVKIGNAYGYFYAIGRTEETFSELQPVPTLDDILSGEKTERAKNIDEKIDLITKTVLSLTTDDNIASTFIREYLENLKYRQPDNKD